MLLGHLVVFLMIQTIITYVTDPEKREKGEGT